MIWAFLWCVDAACVSCSAIIAMWYASSLFSPAPDLGDCPWSTLVFFAISSVLRVCSSIAKTHSLNDLYFHPHHLEEFQLYSVSAADMLRNNFPCWQFSNNVFTNVSFFNCGWVNSQLLCKQRLDVEIRKRVRNRRVRVRKVNLSGSRLKTTIFDNAQRLLKETL